MAAAAPFIMMAAAAVGAVAAIKQGEFSAAAAERERIAAEEQAKLAKIQAAQQEAIRLEQLRKTKGQQLAAAAALGFDPTQTRSFYAIQTESERIAGKDIMNIRLMGLVGARRFSLTADAAKVAGEGAVVGSRLSAVGSLLNGASSSALKVGKTNYGDQFSDTGYESGGGYSDFN